jgi:two-component system CAI-1 autoinducer sensor kinase/phosphatase CqsS
MQKRVLIAEDYDDTRAFMKFILEKDGYEVVEAKNGLEAVEVAQHQHIDLILMDLGMPIMNGLTATQIIRQSGHEFSKIPIIAITAYGQTYYQKAREAGCNAVINKLLDSEIIELTINSYLSE